MGVGLNVLKNMQMKEIGRRQSIELEAELNTNGENSVNEVD